MDEYDKYFEDDKIPSDGAEDADCCKLFSCCWVRHDVDDEMRITVIVRKRWFDEASLDYFHSRRQMASASELSWRSEQEAKMGHLFISSYIYIWIL